MADDAVEGEIVPSTSGPQARRRTVLTEEKLRIITEAVRGGASLAAACGLANVSARTAWLWMQKGRALVQLVQDGELDVEDLDPDWDRLYFLFAYNVDEARSRVEVEMGQLLVEKAHGGQLIERRTITRGSGQNATTEVVERYDPGDWKAAQFWLRTRARGQWDERHIVELGSAAGNGQVADVGDDPDEAIAIRLREFVAGALAPAPQDEQQAS